jgi:hypothetical protein
MIRVGTPADLPAAGDVYRRASLSNAGDRVNPAAGFIDCGTAKTAFGPAQRKRLTLR